MVSSNNGISSEGSSTGINPDKAIARLLYAMLKQKSLKDVSAVHHHHLLFLFFDLNLTTFFKDRLESSRL
jgi:hypothetical protein